MGSWEYNSSVAEDSYRKALSVGYTLFDTAYGYHNQDGVGRALNTVPRSSVFLETKVPGCGLDGVSNSSPEACANGTKEMLEANLKELNMSYVDLVLIHEPPKGAFSIRSCHLVCDQVKAQWKVLQEFYEQKKARAVGVSNYCYSCMECLDWNETVTPMVNQVEYHIGMGTSSGIHGDKGMKTFADAHGVVMQAYSALGGGDAFRKAIIEGQLETEIAKAHNVSSVQVALKWIVEQGIPALTKADNHEYLIEDADLWSWNFTASEMAKLTAKERPIGLPSFACSR
jgi:diketogulonate reductase-like aldo/keto reductase